MPDWLKKKKLVNKRGLLYGKNEKKNRAWNKRKKNNYNRSLESMRC